MYLDCLVKMPNAPGKIVCQKKSGTTYVYYETGRTYDPDKQYTAPKRVVIGKLSKDDLEMIQPNENFLRFFPDEELLEEKDRSVRSSCLRIEYLEAKIEKAQQNVIKTKAAYDSATAELKKLLDKRDALKKDELMAAVVKSQKSYDDIMKFLAEDA